MTPQPTKTVLSQLRVSVAKASDLRLVSRLCKRAVGPSDYVLRILKEVIGERGLFLAWNDDALVGMTNFEECMDGSGWLSMARTDRSFRGKGIAVFLQQEIAKHARKSGIRILRLWTSSTNTPAIRACSNAGFKPVWHAAHVSYHLPSTRKSRPSHTLMKIYRDALVSDFSLGDLSKMNRYVAYNWYFVKPTREVLEEVIRRRELYAINESTFILTKPVRIFGTRYSSFALLDGKVAPSLRHAKQAGKIMGARILGSYIPYDRYQLTAAAKSGFRRDHWGKHCIVFEKKI